MLALTGTCTVAIVPPAQGDEDMDACGDHANGNLFVPVTNVTAACIDSNGDGRRHSRHRRQVPMRAGADLHYTTAATLGQLSRNPETGRDSSSELPSP